jgi:hypothetical protein
VSIHPSTEAGADVTSQANEQSLQSVARNTASDFAEFSDRMARTNKFFVARRQANAVTTLIS